MYSTIAYTVRAYMALELSNDPILFPKNCSTNNITSDYPCPYVTDIEMIKLKNLGFILLLLPEFYIFLPFFI